MGIGCSQCDRDQASRDDVYISGAGTRKNNSETENVILNEAPKDEELLPAELRSSATTCSASAGRERGGGDTSRSEGFTPGSSPPPPLIDQGGLASSEPMSLPPPPVAEPAPAAARPAPTLNSNAAARSVQISDRVSTVTAGSCTDAPPGLWSLPSVPSAVSSTVTDGGDTFDTAAAGSTHAEAGETWPTVADDAESSSQQDVGLRLSGGKTTKSSTSGKMKKTATQNLVSMMRKPSRMWTNPSPNSRGPASTVLDPLTGSPRLKAKPSGNTNKPLDYRWLERVLLALADNSAASLGCTDTATGHAFTPILLVLGVCPNTFCGMQAIMYCANAKGDIDFWWVKPDKDNAADVEKQTLSRQAKGPHKNDPGRSKPFYIVLANMFAKGERNMGRRFGVDITSHTSPRCWIEEPRPLPGKAGEGPWKMWLNVVWIEDWTTNPFARSKFIKGKIVYQKDPSAIQFFARQYYILDDNMQILDHEEPSFDTVLPPKEDFKDLWVMSGC